MTVRKMHVRDGNIIGSIKHLESLETIAWFLYGAPNLVGYSENTNSSGAKNPRQIIHINFSPGKATQTNGGESLIKLPKAS